MSENAAERAIRLLDLVPFILDHQGISINQLAKEFNVSKEEIIKDLNLLFVCGLPGYTPLELIDISFEDELVYLRDPQNLSEPRTLTISEMIVTRIALSALHELVSDPEKRAEIQALQSKFSALFQSALPENAIHVEIDKEQRTQKIVQHAIESGRNLSIEYLNLTKDEVSSREITPIELVKSDQGMTLNAFCHRVGAVRSFKIAQIISAVESDGSQMLFNATVQEESGVEVQLRTSDSDSSLINRLVKDVKSLGDNVYVIKIYQEEWLIRTVFSQAGLELASPFMIRELLRKEAKSALKRYQEFSA
ncbi:MAG: WYL domain-containing protein [Candidatus Nanopelagicaceae bacterium]